MSLEDRIRMKPFGGNDDDRRSIRDLYIPRDKNVGFINCINVTPRPTRNIDASGRLILGNHYHEVVPSEVFYLAQGRSRVVLEDIDTKEHLEIDLEQHGMLQIPRRVAHTFLAEPSSILIAYMLGVVPDFNPNDRSVYIAYELVKPVK